MGETTKISWCDATHNEWIGCTKVSPGCDHCYAEAQNIRWKGGANWGKGAPRRLTTLANRRKPFAWDKAAKAEGVRRRVFCSSLSDVFDSEVDPAWRESLFGTIRATPNLDWLLLTKRPHSIRQMLPADWGGGWANVWLGTTVEAQPQVDLRITKLVDIPAIVHFLSIEPQIASVTLRAARSGWRWAIDWIIIGGESGAGARPFDVQWARELIAEAREFGIAPFVKQLGRVPMVDGRPLQLKDGHGGDWSEWPESLADLRVREVPIPEVRHAK